MITIKNLSFKYGKLEVYNNFNLHVPEGQSCLITGINGVGKSTLLRLIAGVLLPDAGKVEYNHKLGDMPKKKIGFISDKLSLYESLSVDNSIELHKSVFGINKFDDLFEKAYFSFDIGMIKPNSDIFNFVISENNLNPKETLFIDDSIRHIEAAKKLGLQTYFIEKETIIDIFNYKE